MLESEFKAFYGEDGALICRGGGKLLGSFGKIFENGILLLNWIALAAPRVSWVETRG